MDWFNFYGLGAMLCLLLPNALYAARPHDTEEKCPYAFLLVLETIFRFACMALMVVRFESMGAGFASDADRTRWFWWVGALIALYWIGWLIYARRGASVATALPLALLPCAVFALSGVWMRLPALIICACVFAVLHVAVTLLNVLRKPAPTEPTSATEETKEN